MPTKKKRVGFIPREEVMKIIDKLSIENNLSISKIISILVEEALSIRGIFNKKNGEASQTFLDAEYDSQDLNGDSVAFKDNKNKDNKNLKTNSKLGNNKNSRNITTLLKEANHEDFNLQTYKKFLSFLKFQEMMDEYNT